MLKPTICSHPRQVLEALAGHLSTLSAQSVARRGVFCWALAGGRTPQAFYRLLAGPPYARRLEWNRFQIFWGDERCVPPDHPESNFRLAREALLQHVPVPPAQIHRIRGEEDPAAEVARYGHEIRRLVGAGRPGWPVFDFILLGVGTDGHTASLFPGTDFMAPGDALCAATRHPASGQWRVTLTLPVLNHARQTAFLATGEEKAEAIGAIFSSPEAAATLPAAAVRGAHVTWFLDAAAAAGLPVKMQPGAPGK